MNDEPFRLVGEPRFGGILIVSDHASNRVPPGVDLGIDAALLMEHVAIDIGVAAVAERMAAWMATGEHDDLFHRFNLRRFSSGRLEREDMIIG